MLFLTILEVRLKLLPLIVQILCNIRFKMLDQSRNLLLKLILGEYSLDRQWRRLRHGGGVWKWRGGDHRLKLQLQRRHGSFVIRRYQSDRLVGHLPVR
ncbi:hypothetical protein KFK09_003373 [Dendrobium nobile]|uniref:Secreted protein n=1 Tax=Dendrobium nobile TaxID=94219 RepID=A0A8T3BXL7_DENNO|nr:hypothetical protein KFK09_003373 [Dendrobium nobile]